MRKKVKFQSTDGINLVGILEIPKGKPPFPIIVMVHGHQSSKDSKSYTILEKFLHPLGIATFRFDYRGHGESGGKYENLTVTSIVNDIESAIDFLFKKFSNFLVKEKLVLYGGSLSGFATVLATSSDQRVRYLIVRSGVVDFYNTYGRLYNIQNWQKKGVIKVSSKFPWQKQLKYGFYEDGVRHNLLIKARKIKVPTLVIHGSEDKEISVNDARSLFENLTSVDKTFKLIKGADHWYHGKRREMQQTIVDWIKTKINS